MIHYLVLGRGIGMHAVKGKTYVAALLAASAFAADSNTREGMGSNLFNFGFRVVCPAIAR